MPAEWKVSMEKRIFISHSSQNADIAKEMCEFLEENGEKCFLAPRDIRGGKVYAEEIMIGIDESDWMVLILTKASNDSPHVLREIERAVSKNIPIIVYKEEEVQLNKSMEYFLMSNQWLESELSRDFSKLLNCINDKAEKEASNVVNVPEKKKKNYPMIILISLACVFAAIAMVVVCGIAIVFSLSKSNLENKQQQNMEAVIEDEEENNNPPKEIKIGDEVKLGTYLGDEIEWYVIDTFDDGSVELISKDILTMKAFDAAASGEYNSDGENDYWSQDSFENASDETKAYVRGNSDWASSNIRTWLNCEDNIVKFTDGIPNKMSVSGRCNDYAQEKGFLSGFTQEEIGSIVEVELETKGNTLADNDIVVTKDRVYLPSKDTVNKLKENGIGIYAKPTLAAINQNKSDCYNALSISYNTDYHLWWLREPGESSYKALIIYNDKAENEMGEYVVGVEGIGIRPAMRVQTYCLDIIEY